MPTDTSAIGNGVASDQVEQEPTLDELLAYQTVGPRKTATVVVHCRPIGRMRPLEYPLDDQEAAE